MAQYSYKKIVSIFEDAANAHLGVNTFGHGSIDYLDAKSQNVAYPYVFLRPLTSPGLNLSVRGLNFELYCIDVPTLANQEPIDIMSNMEQTLYDMISYFNTGDYQQEIGVQLDNIVPTLEAFNDRAYGWVGNILVTTDGAWNYCNFPN